MTAVFDERRKKQVRLFFLVPVIEKNKIIMKNLLTLSFIILFTGFTYAQQWSDTPSPVRAWMDTIKFPAAEYSNSIVYTLVKPYYLSDAQVNSLASGVRFPANSSDQTRKELDYLLELESKRTPEVVERVTYLANIGYWPTADILPDHPQYKQNLKDLFFEGREIIGDRVTAENLPKTAILLKGVMRDMRIMEFTIKYRLLRPRPYHLEPNLHSLAKINSPSFASGHTLWAFTQAFTWSLIVPEKEKEFLALAEEIRKSREIMGIHFPSDNDAARQVAARMIQYYLDNKQFRDDLAAAREEWKRFR